MSALDGLNGRARQFAGCLEDAAADFRTSFAAGMAPWRAEIDRAIAESNDFTRQQRERAARLSEGAR